MGNAGTKEDRFAFFQGARNGKLDVVKNLLEAGKVSVIKSIDGDGYNVLHYASGFATQPAVIDYLFEHCMKQFANDDYPLEKLLTAKDGWGRTPIYFCAGSIEGSKVEILKKLVDSGATMLGKGKNADELLSDENVLKKKQMLCMVREEEGFTPLDTAIGMCHVEHVKYFTEEVQIDPATHVMPKSKRNPLHMSAMKDAKAEIVEYLLKHEKAKDMLIMRDSEGLTPLALAKREKAMENVSLIEPVVQQFGISE